MHQILITGSQQSGLAGNVFIVRIMHKMEYISKCSILVLKTVYIMMQMVRRGYTVGGVKNVATFIV